MLPPNLTPPHTEGRIDAGTAAPTDTGSALAVTCAYTDTDTNLTLTPAPTMNQFRPHADAQTRPRPYHRRLCYQHRHVECAVDSTDMPRKFRQDGSAMAGRCRNAVRNRIQMCCCATFHTVQFDFCRVCTGDHTMVERRIECRSPSCFEFAE